MALRPSTTPADKDDNFPDPITALKFIAEEALFLAKTIPDNSTDLKYLGEERSRALHEYDLLRTEGNCNKYKQSDDKYAQADQEYRDLHNRYDNLLPIVTQYLRQTLCKMRTFGRLNRITLAAKLDVSDDDKVHDLEVIRWDALAAIDANANRQTLSPPPQEKQEALKALEPKEPAQPPLDIAAIVRETLKQSEAAKEPAEAEHTKKPERGEQLGQEIDDLEEIRSALNGQLLQIFDLLCRKRFQATFQDLLDAPSIVWRNREETSIEGVVRAVKRLADKLNTIGTKYSVTCSRQDQRVTLNR